MSKGMLGKLPLAKLSGPVGSLFETLGSEDGEEILEELKKFNRKEPCWISTSQNAMMEEIDPKEFYQTNDSLLIDPDFVAWIVSVAKPAKTGKKFSKNSFQTLKNSTTGRELLNKYPKSVWDPTVFCWCLAVELTKQLKNQEDVIFDKDKLYLFTVKGVDQNVFVVSVNWSSICREWHVDAWALDSVWDAGDRFFSKPT